ncbi:MAG: aerial mycelium formation protein, partial [Acidimicrobiales bacterium]
RARRDACQQAADELSYLRRFIQGRLALVHEDLQRRASGAPGDLAGVVTRLGEILGEGRHSETLGEARLPRNLAPAEPDGWIAAELNSIVGPDRLGALPEATDAELDGVAGALIALERRVSAQRRLLHERANALQDEIVRRYKSGDASVEELLPK